MLFQDLRQIRVLRKNKGLTQAELARISGVSQSLIAKIEAGLIDPSFSNAQKIINALSSVDSGDYYAKDLMSKRLISFLPSLKASEAVKVMRSKNISQAPVIVNNSVLGLVTEKCLLENLDSLPELLVSDVMEPAPPIVPLTTGVRLVADLLQSFSSVLVADKGKVLGIITKSDVLKAFADKKQKHF